MKTVRVCLAVITAALGIGFGACEKKPVTEMRPRHLAPDGMYYLISAKKLPRELAPLKLKSGAELVHLGGDEYQAGEHRIRLASDLVTNDTRIRSQILESLRAQEEEDRAAREEQEQRDREAAQRRATPVPPSALSKGAYDQRRQVRPNSSYIDSSGRRVYSY